MKSLINRKAAKAADSMYRRKGMFSRGDSPKPRAVKLPEPLPKHAACLDFIEGKENAYPLCDNSACKEMKSCCLSSCMVESAYDNYDK